jgi:hypothetical protein
MKCVERSFQSESSSLHVGSLSGHHLMMRWDSREGILDDINDVKDPVELRAKPDCDILGQAQSGTVRQKLV